TDHFELGRPLDRKVLRLCALQDLVHIGCRAAIIFTGLGPQRAQTHFIALSSLSFRSLLVFLLVSGRCVWELRESDRTCDPCAVEFLDCRNAIQHEQLRPLNVIWSKCGIGGSARQPSSLSPLTTPRTYPISCAKQATIKFA